MPSLTIRARLLIAFCLLVIAPIALLGALFSSRTGEILEQRVFREMRLEVASAADTLETYLGGVRRDLLSLARLLERRMSPEMDPRRWREIAEEFYRVTEAESSYYQVRFIGEDGWEKLRVNNYRGRLVPVPPEEFQYKGKRYYVPEALELAPGEIYLSPLDYNVEHGRIEEPRRLVTRMATPVADQQGSVEGIVVINIFGDDLLKMLEALPPVGGSKLFLAGEEDYVERYRSDEGVTVEIGEVKDLSSVLEVPLGDLRKGDRPRFIEKETVLLAAAPIDAAGSDWLLVKTFPKRLLDEDVAGIRRSVMLLAILLLLPAAALAVAAARSFSRPIDRVIQFADAIAAGDYEQRMHHPGRDEFSHLTATLNDMAEALAASRRRLENWNRDLQLAVERKTEELQSAMKELEKREEELAFLNEELVSNNAELQNRISELEQNENEIGTLVESSRIAVLLLDPEMKIVRFTPAAGEIFNLLATDAGRSILHFTRSIEYPGLERDVDAVLEGEDVPPREVVDYSGSQRFRVRLSPWRGAGPKIEGVVITFTETGHERSDEPKEE